MRSYQCRAHEPLAKHVFARALLFSKIIVIFIKIDYSLDIHLANSELVAAKEKLEIVSGTAPPPFRIFAGLRLADPRYAEGSGEARLASATQAGGFSRRRRRRNAFGLF